MNAFAKGRKGSISGLLERAQAFTVQSSHGSTETSTSQVVQLSRIVANPHQPRRHFDAEQLNALASSIRTHGILQPILVRPAGDQFEIVFGERRFRAAKLAALQSIPVRIQHVSDQEMAVLAALENLQREDLNRFEEVTSKVSLIAQVLEISVDAVPDVLRKLRAQPEAFPEEVESLTELFTRLGGEQWRSFVVNGLPVLRLAEPLRSGVREGALDYSKALLIARVSAEHHQQLLDATLQENLTQQSLKERIKALAQPADTAKASHVTTLRRQLSPRSLAKLSSDQRERAEQLMAELAALFV